MLKPEIGKTAGEVWKYLGKNGKVSVTDLPNKVRANPDLVHQAIGWLAREEKVAFTKQARMTYVSLTDTELNNYRQSAGCGM